MIAMELSEVVNPQFAFPVVGVVLCAVLVFALGFKSPVQPPSFDFEDEKPNKSKKKKTKKLQNGHVANDLPSASPSSSSKQVKHSPGNKQTADKLELTKQKKKATPKAAVSADKDDAPESTKEPDTVFTGVWTKALSRKERKMRGRKDERPDKYTDEGWADEPSAEATPPVDNQVTESISESEVGPEGVNTEAKKPLEQRSNKKDKKKKSAGEPSVAAMTVTKPVVTATSVVAAKAAAEEEEKEEEKANIPEVTKPETTIPEITENTEPTPSKPVVVESTERKSPKKKKKKSSRLPEAAALAAPVVTEIITEMSETGDVVRETSVPDPAAAIAEAMQEINDVETPEVEIDRLGQGGEAVSPDEPKPARSPKKKKKRDKDKTQATSLSSVSAEASHREDLTEEGLDSNTDSRVDLAASLSSLSQPQSSGAAIDRLEAPSAEDLSSAAQSEGAENSPKPSTSSEDQSKVTFDELGDWQEAKPVKKKKKPRREN